MCPANRLSNLVIMAWPPENRRTSLNSILGEVSSLATRNAQMFHSRPTHSRDRRLYCRWRIAAMCSKSPAEFRLMVETRGSIGHLKSDACLFRVIREIYVLPDLVIQVGFRRGPNRKFLLGLQRGTVLLLPLTYGASAYHVVP